MIIREVYGTNGSRYQDHHKSTYIRALTPFSHHSGWRSWFQPVSVLLNFQTLMCFPPCVVTTFFIPTAKQVIGGRALLGILSISKSPKTLLPFFLSRITCSFLEELCKFLSSITQLERTSPVLWFKIRSTPSMPPATNSDVSFRWCCKEYTTFGLARLSHSTPLFLQALTSITFQE